MKKISLLLFLLMSFTFTVLAQTRLTPEEILTKTINKISGTTGLQVNFSVTTGGYSSKGEIFLNKNKFRVSLPDAMVWYNGKDLYTLNKNTDETTVITPSEEELEDSNPLAYISSSKRNYTVTFSTVKKSGSYVLELVTKTKRSEIKRITLTVNAKDYTPERLVIEPTSGTPTRADINTFKTVSTISPGEFEYPKAKFPKVEVIDLR